MRFFVSGLQALVIASWVISGHSFFVQPVCLFFGESRNVYGNAKKYALYSNLSKSLSTADQERRDEEKRRIERKDDVIPGKTSAIEGATDYSIDVRSTTEQYLRQASKVEEEIYRMTELGMEMIRSFRLDEAAKAFDRVFELKPNAYLWQAGIVKFYLDDLDGAVEVLSRCATIYESRFEEIASEERIWGNAALLKKISTMSRKARKNQSMSGNNDNLVLKISGSDRSDFSYTLERRKVVRLALGLFESSCNGDFVTTVVSRAKLRAIGGSVDSIKPTMDYKLWKISSWYYLGLYYDVIGDYHASKLCMKTALRLLPNSRSDDLIHNLPMLHMTVRNWFDDDEFDLTETDFSVSSDENGKRLKDQTQIDPIIIESLQSSLKMARIVDLQTVLRKRGLRATGSKLVLQNRLLESLINDATLLS